MSLRDDVEAAIHEWMCGDDDGEHDNLADVVLGLLRQRCVLVEDRDAAIERMGKYLAGWASGELGYGIDAMCALMLAAAEGRNP